VVGPPSATSGGGFFISFNMKITLGLIIPLVERFLEKYPQYQGSLLFVQLGAPSRTHIKRYQDFLAEMAEAECVNWRFQSGE